MFTLKTVSDETHWNLSPSSTKSSNVTTRSSYNHLLIVASTKKVVHSVRYQNKKTNARVKGRKSPYLLPEPCDSDVHEDCVAIDCEMVGVHSEDRSRRNALESVTIVNKKLECVYEKFVQPPSDRSINQKSRPFCPVSEQEDQRPGEGPKVAIPSA